MCFLGCACAVGLVFGGVSVDCAGACFLGVCPRWRPRAFGGGRGWGVGAGWKCIIKHKLSYRYT